MGHPLSLRCMVVLVVLGLSGFASNGCSEKSIPAPAGESPEEQYGRVVESLRAGRLSEAYEAWIPPSYAKDLDVLVRRAGELLGPEDLALVTRELGELGATVGKTLAASQPDGKLAGFLSERAAGVAEFLSGETLASVKELGATGLVRAVETGGYAELAAIPEFGEQFGEIRFATAKREREWARVDVQQTRGEESTHETLEVVRIEGRWIPVDWVGDWPRIIAAGRKAVEDVAAMKQEQPEQFRAALTAGLAGLRSSAVPELVRLLSGATPEPNSVEFHPAGGEVNPGVRGTGPWRTEPSPGTRTVPTGQ